MARGVREADIDGALELLAAEFEGDEEGEGLEYASGSEGDGGAGRGPAAGGKGDGSSAESGNSSSVAFL